MTPIRLTHPGDYPALAELRTVIYPEYPQVAADVADYDHACMQSAEYCFKRWVYELNDRVVGTAYHVRNRWYFHPDKMSFQVLVHPDFTRRGIGSA
jgi:GNAT superfamily N-acetyltransferase